MSNINDALKILLNETEPVIYDYEKSNGYTFITIGYTGGRYFALSIEMLIDDSSSPSMLSLVSDPDDSLNINKKNCKNHLWAEILMNDINASQIDKQHVGVWSCSLECDSVQNATELIGKVTFQFVLNIPKVLDAKSTAELIKAGVESFRSSVGRIQRFIHKCQASESALEFDDVFPEKSNNVEICFHPKFLDILNRSNENE